MVLSCWLAVQCCCHRPFRLQGHFTCCNLQTGLHHNKDTCNHLTQTSPQRGTQPAIEFLARRSATGACIIVCGTTHADKLDWSSPRVIFKSSRSSCWPGLIVREPPMHACMMQSSSFVLSWCVSPQSLLLLSLHCCDMRTQHVDTHTLGVFGKWIASCCDTKHDRHRGNKGLINAAIRHAKDQLDLDLSPCSSWLRFVEVHYARPHCSTATAGSEETSEVWAAQFAKAAPLVPPKSSAPRSGNNTHKSQT